MTKKTIYADAAFLSGSCRLKGKRSKIARAGRGKTMRKLAENGRVKINEQINGKLVLKEKGAVAP